MLATLFREMCGVTPLNKAKIRGFLLLLQSRAHYVGIPTAFKDIWLLLDQWSEVQVNIK
ncbi:hypothetical protein Godav_000629 [Gossypium davidsonii]|uniref:Uncharacterized protein n=1 Tax=Gossypium davidsonii TaxID=34287 RepID=A0A7J8T073_GOSDV|nr:hypothetical protein [Gossypium davidsonii]